MKPCSMCKTRDKSWNHSYCMDCLRVYNKNRKALKVAKEFIYKAQYLKTERVYKQNGKVVQVVKEYSEEV